MKIAIISDTHAGARGDNQIFNEFFFKFWENTFFPYLKEHNIKHICHLGDVVDRRKFINFVTLNSWRSRFFDRLLAEGITMDVIVGNHDVFFRNTNEINAMTELFSSYSNINVYLDPVVKQYDSLEVALVPWINSGNYESSLQFLKDTSAQVVFGHFEISGFEMDRGNVCHAGMSRSVFDKFDMVLSGHFHHKSTDGLITYLGNQYEITWADHGDQRGFHVFDTETREIEFVPNPNSIFHKLSYDDTLNDFDFWKNYDYRKFKDCYVKIIVVNKTNPYLFDIVIDNLYKSEAADVSIVEDFSETLVEDDDEIINQAEDTLTIINKVIDSNLGNLEAPKFKSLVKELYLEALQTEQNI